MIHASTDTATDTYSDYYKKNYKIRSYDDDSTYTITHINKESSTITIVLDQIKEDINAKQEEALTALAENAVKSRIALRNGLFIKIKPKIKHVKNIRHTMKIIPCNRKGMGLRIRKRTKISYPRSK